MQDASSAQPDAAGIIADFVSRALVSSCVFCVAVVVIAALPSAEASGASGQTVPSQPLLTAVMASEFVAPDKRIAFERTRQAGAGFARLLLYWQTVAPIGSSPPAGFNGKDPNDSHYRWQAFDEIVSAALASGVVPIVDILGAPAWAQDSTVPQSPGGPVRPNLAALADFATAAATRYSGSRGLPRVRYWQIWNEANLSPYLRPQLENGKPVSPDLYRALVNAAARAIHAVRRDNVVIAGGLAPFGGNLNDPSGEPTLGQERIHPLRFMRQMLCMSKGAKPTATCNQRSEFDVWAHHPYTYGGPTHSAFHPDDASLGDLGVMRKLLEAAKAAEHIQSRQKLGFWVTEFSYDSKPEDPKGLPPDLHARWVSEALYRMWSNGVSLVTWFLLRDQPFPAEMFQSGLYTRGETGISSDKPKPALTAFRFPFVAFREKDRSISYWGRTPAGVKKAATVEQKRGSRWVRLVTPKVDRYGIFQGRIPSVRESGPLRARLPGGKDLSLPFSLKVPKDFRFCPWGSFC